MKNENLVEGRNAVLELFRSGKEVDKIYIQDGSEDGPIKTIIREAKKHKVYINFVTKDRLASMSETGKHQGVIAIVAAYNYVEVDDIFAKAKRQGEEPFIIIADGIEDPYNLGAIIRSANQAGAHGVIIPKHRAVGLNASVARSSAGAVYHTLVAKVTNISMTIETMKKRGLWLACADMNGEPIYKANLKGPMAIVVGNEGDGVSELVRKHCDMKISIPMYGDIDSLNASVAAGIIAFEIVRQRRFT